MTRRRRTVLVLGVFLAAAGGVGGAAGCASDDPAPVASILSVTPDSIDPLDDAADDVTIALAFSDADADLGGGLATVHDCRVADLTILLPLPAIASEEAIAEGVPIEGELSLVIADVGELAADAEAPPACADLGVEPPSDDAVVFCVILTDLAGNDGPGDCTTPVALVAPG